jgi:signal peptidase I
MSDTSADQPATDQPAAEGEAGEGAPKKNMKGKLLHEFRETALTIAIFVPFWLLFSTFVYELRSIPSESMVPALQVGDRVAVAKFAYGYNRNSIPFGVGMLVIGDKTCPEAANAEQAKECVDGERMFASLPKRGDVIVFQHPHQPDRVMIKRLIGLPGDTVQVKEGKLYLNGTEVPREKVRVTTYIPADNSRLQSATEYRQTIPTGEGDKTKSFLIHEWSDSEQLDDTPLFKVPPGHVFMMGDNRDNSEDSRAPSGHRRMATQFPEAWPRRITMGLPDDPAQTAVGFVPMDYLIGRAETVLFTVKDFPFGCKAAPGAECPEGTLWKGL